MLKTSLVIAGDSSGAQKAVGDLAAGSQKLVIAQSNLTASSARAEAAAIRLQLAQEAAAAAADRDAAAQARAAATLAGAQASVAASIAGQTRAQQQLADASKRVVEGHTHMSNSGAIMQHVVRSTTDSFVAGLPISMIFGEQIGRVGEAAAMSGGALGKFGAILAGPWGIAATAAVSIAGVLVGKWLEGGDALKEQSKAMQEALAASDSFGAAQSLLAKAVDLSTGALKTGNIALLERIKLTAQLNIVNAQREGRESREKLEGYGKPTFGQRLFDAIGDAGSAESGGGPIASQARQAQLAPLQGFLDTYSRLSRSNASQADLDRGLQAGLRGIDAAGRAGRLNGANPDEIKDAFIKVATAHRDEQANQYVLDYFKTGKIAPELKPYEKPDKPKKARSTDGVERYGDEASSRIADIIGRYNADPAQAGLEKTSKEVRALDDLIAQLGRRKPPGFEDMIASAEKAKVVVREGIVAELAKAFDKPRTLADQAAAAFAQLDVIEADLRKNKPQGFEEVIASAEKARVAIAEGLQRPYTDFIKSQRDGLAVMQLQAAGRQDEAEALRQIQTLEKSMGPLTAAQKDGVLATVEALRAEQRELDTLREKNAKYLEAIGSIRTIVDDATQAFVRGDLGQIIKSPGKLLDAFQTLQGRALFDKVFGGLFTELEDQVNGTSVVKDASARMATAVDTASASITKLGNVADAVAGRAANDNGSVQAMLARGNGAPPKVDLDGNQVGADVVVTANRSPASIFAGALGKVGTSVLSALTNPEAAKRIGSAIGTASGIALKGAAEGSIVAGVGRALGVNLSSSGSQLGGAVGGLLGSVKGITSALGPLGGFLTPALSIVGGLFGSIFGSAKYGQTTITSAGASGTTGNDSESKSASVQTANAVLTTLGSIAKALGGSATGDIGTITVGAYKGKYRVNDHGTNLASNNDVVQYDTIEEARTFATDVALARGAIQGITAEVQKALTNPDVGDEENRLNEALSVQKLQLQLGGISASLKQIFDTEDATAKERLRLAKTYGLDVVATEKANADSLSKLMASTLKSATGSLQSVLDDLATGDLYEGSASDRRTALQAKIVDARTRADAGEDGAGDELATLYRNLLSTSKDAYGTAASEYAADRATVSSGASAVIKAEQDRINQAAGLQAKIADNTGKSVALADETNDILLDIKAQLAAAAAAGGGGYDGVLPNYAYTKVGEGGMSRRQPAIAEEDREPPNLCTLGGRLRSERERLRLSRADAAVLMGVAEGIVVKLEGTLGNGDYASALKQLAHAGADVLFIVTGIRNQIGKGAGRSAGDEVRYALEELPNHDRQRLLLHLVTEELKASLRS